MAKYKSLFFVFLMMLSQISLQIQNNVVLLHRDK